MPMKIAILEDNIDRQAAMRRCIADRFYTFETHFFDESAAMIRFLAAHLKDTIAISLDNDLEFKPGPDGRMIDSGSGVDVVEFLKHHEPSCQVIIHTTNTNAAETSIEMLKDAGWTTRRVIPFDDMAWIDSNWFFAVRRALVGPITNKPKRNVEVR
jgi:hypothetical protein